MNFRQPSNKIAHSPVKESQDVIKKRIVEAAGRLFRNRGLSRVSIGEISKEAKTSVPGFYSCFASRDELLVVLIQQESQQRLAQIGCLNKFDDFFKGVEELLFHLTHDDRKHFSPSLRIEMFSFASRSDVVAKQIADCKTALIEKIVGSLLLAQSRGQVAPTVEPDNAARIIISAAEALMVNAHLPPEILEEQRSATLALMKRGLVPRFIEKDEGDN